MLLVTVLGCGDDIGGVVVVFVLVVGGFCFEF